LDSGGSSSSSSGGPATGFLRVASATHAGVVNLTTEGQKDWAYWGANPTVQKNVPTHVINGFTESLGRTLQYTSPSTSVFSWSDGTPTMTGTARSDLAGYQADTVDVVFNFPATQTRQTLVLYLGGYKATTRFEATISDGSAPLITDTSQSSSVTTFSSRFEVEFNSFTPAATLVIHWRLVSRVDDGFITVKAATLL